MTPIRLAAILIALPVVLFVAYSRRGFMRNPSPNAIAPDRARGVIDVLVLAVAIALTVGLLEVGFVWFRQEIVGKFAFWRLNAA